MKLFQILLLCLFCFSLSAQEENRGENAPTGFYTSLHVQLGIPVSDFKEKQADLGLGWAYSLYYELKKPISIGLNVAWQKYDREREAFISFDPDGFDFLLEEETSNQILNLATVLRVQPELDFPVRPYAEGFVGFDRFYTRTVFTDLDVDEQLNSQRDHADWTLSYGGAAGLLINLFQNNLFLDLKCNYRLGNIVEFNTRIEGADFSVPIDNFELREAAPTMLTPQIGITAVIISEKQ